MGETTAIQWAHSTFNVRWGCTRVSPACQNCYAETLAKRYGYDVWDRDGDRRELSEHYWNEPLRWERKAAASGEPWRVFCSSMADVFEQAPAGLGARYEAERARLWTLIGSTPNLTWMLLTKRPENIRRMVPLGWHVGGDDGNGSWPANVWVGTTVENQRYADLRLPKLLRIPAPVRFVSCEPLLGAVDLSEWLDPPCPDDPDGLHYVGCGCDLDSELQWVIGGGESGPGARPWHPAWARTLRDQCLRYEVPFFWKQHGEWAPAEMDSSGRWVIVEMDGTVADVAGALPTSTGAVMARVGKRAAGRLLEGNGWAEFPPSWKETQ